MMILSLFLHSEPLDLESWAEFAASNWELSWKQHKLPHLRRIIAQAEVDSWITTVSLCVTRLVTRGFGNIEFSHSVISTQPSDRQCMYLVVQAVDKLVSRFQGNASVASIVVMETFSKIDPKRVRASTSSPRLTCDYFKHCKVPR